MLTAPMLLFSMCRNMPGQMEAVRQRMKASEADNQQHRERGGVGVRDGEEQRTDHDGDCDGHTPAQTRKDEAAKEYFFTEGRDKYGCKERRVGGYRCLFAARQENLVVGLQVEMKVGDDDGV